MDNLDSLVIGLMVNGWGFVFDEDCNFFSYRFSVGSFFDGFIFVSGSFV